MSLVGLVSNVRTPSPQHMQAKRIER
jgi:hypothetical protein